MSTNPCPTPAATAQEPAKKKSRTEDIVHAAQQVRNLQTSVGIHADGICGDETVVGIYKFITSFQSQQTMPITGECNSRTLKAMSESKDPNIVKAARALSELGDANLLDRLYQVRRARALVQAKQAAQPAQVAINSQALDCPNILQSLLPNLSTFKGNIQAQVQTEAVLVTGLIQQVQARLGMKPEEQNGRYNEKMRALLINRPNLPINAKDLDELQKRGILNINGAYDIPGRLLDAGFKDTRVRAVTTSADNELGNLNSQRFEKRVVALRTAI